MNKQFAVIIEEATMSAFSSMFPALRAIEVMGLPIKSADGTEYMAMVMPVPKMPLENIAPIEHAQVEVQPDAPQG